MSAHADPLVRLADDRRRARDANDPWANLCVLGTVDRDGRAQTRVLVLRDIDERLGIFVNATSPKCAELERGADAAVLVYLASLGIQYRLRTTLSPIDAEIVSASWQQRPRIPQVMDWLYTRRAPQSTRLDSRDALTGLFSAVDAELGPTPVAPATALGFYLDVTQLERLQLAGDRVHDRVEYTRTPNGWQAHVLIP